MKKSINNSKNEIQTVALHNLGCKVNAYETEKMANALANAGFLIVGFDNMADVYIINTCSVTQTADKKSRQMIRRARHRNPQAVVIAAGCFVQATKMAPEDVGADIFVGNDKKGEIVEIVAEYLEKKRPLKEVIDINDPAKEYEELYCGSASGIVLPGETVEDTVLDHTRAYVKIQDGCNQFCTYCRIPYVRGRTRSRKAESILEEIRQLNDHGYKEVVLTGIHISSYRDENLQLVDLIERIEKECDCKRLRLGSMEPRLVTEETAKRMAACPSLCAHFHLSLQSGCDATIRRMNRKYTTEDYLGGVDSLRRHFKDPAITTDVIVGFPGETDEEFAATEAFVNRIGFADMHVFKFSAREGTRAYEMDNRVPETVKNERSDRLLAAAAKMHDAFYERWKDRNAQVLFEEKVKKDGRLCWTGFTGEYLRVYHESDEELKNEIRSVTVS